ncbi:MAG: hypothetical protein J6S05_05405 [Bacteroidaceae bacterium]|nr:hypothetical protein [Bacteroidaceae bacterium]
MPTLTYLGDEYSCATAIKGADYIHLLNEAGVMIAAFDEITDFSGFKLTNGSYTSPVADHDCYLAVLRDDGTIGRGGHKCSDIPQTAADVGALPIGGGTLTGMTLGLREGQAIFEAYPGNLDIISRRTDASNQFKFRLNNDASLSRALMLYQTVNGETTEYAIYGKHNKPTAADVGAVAKTGDTMTGQLHIDTNQMGRGVIVGGNTENAYFASIGSGGVNNQRTMQIRNADTTTPATNALQYAVWTDSKSVNYTILHTGNLSANGVARIETGSYVGTGELSKSLTLSGEPQMLIVSDGSPLMYGTDVHNFSQFIWHKGVTKHIVAQHSYGQGNRNFVVDGNTIRWSAEVEVVSSSAMNISGETYYYTAIVK